MATEQVSGSVPLLASVEQLPEEREGLCRRLCRRKDNRSKQGLNLLFLVYLGKIGRLMFPRLKSGTLLMFVFLLFVRGAEEFNVYNVGLVPSLFYKVIDSKDLDGFKQTLWTAALAVVSIAVCKSVRLWVAGVLYVRWRVLITSALHKLYFKDIFYYQLKIQEFSIDNPDQRITQDVDRFCQQLQNIVPQLVISPFVIAYYTYETYNSMGFYGPLSIYAFAILTAIVNKFLISPVVRAVFRQEAYEGDFRFHHVQFRVNAESAAFYRGGSIEGRNANKRLSTLYTAQHRVVDWTLPVNLSVNLFDYSGSILSYCLIGIPVFLGYYDHVDVATLSSIVSKNSFVSLYLLNNFSQLMDLSTNISDLAGYTHRIGELLVTLRKMDKAAFKKSQTVMEDDDDNGSYSEDKNAGEVDGFHCISLEGVNNSDFNIGLKVRQLSVGPPGWEYPMLKDVTFNFERNKNILIIGETGYGKSSLIKVISGLWAAKGG
jgi:ATP-binding cassette subfamily D (ALD) protein 4